MSEIRRLLPTMPKMGLLLIFLPVAIAMEIAGMHGLPLFVASALDILGTVTLIGKATEEVAIYSILLSLAAATMIASSTLGDGQTNWMEGAMFLAVYLFFSVVFWFHP